MLFVRSYIFLIFRKVLNTLERPSKKRRDYSSSNRIRLFNHSLNFLHVKGDLSCPIPHFSKSLQVRHGHPCKIFSSKDEINAPSLPLRHGFATLHHHLKLVDLYYILLYPKLLYFSRGIELNAIRFLTMETSKGYS